MKREDILLALKEAEEKTKGMVEEARKASERNLAKAKQDAALKLTKGRVAAADLKERHRAARLLKMEEEATIIRERGKLRAERLREVSEANVERAIEILMKAFERDLDV
ncbi:MAG: hypothetical protein R6W91_07660 [Thermoplasmata archaeon]